MRRTIAGIIVLCLIGPALADPEATRLLNGLRQSEGRTPISYSSKLEDAAEVHARDMARGAFFSHDGSDGSDVSARVARTGYNWCIVAENIAKGQTGLVEVMKDWSESPGHRSNMLSAEVTEFALVQETGNIWVMVLAAPGC